MGCQVKVPILKIEPSLANEINISKSTSTSTSIAEDQKNWKKGVMHIDLTKCYIVALGAILIENAKIRGAKKKEPKTYNSRYSLVVTHPTTNLPI